MRLIHFVEASKKVSHYFLEKAYLCKILQAESAVSAAMYSAYVRVNVKCRSIVRTVCNRLLKRLINIVGCLFKVSKKMITFALKRNFVQTKAEPSLLELCREQPKFMNEVHKL